MEALKVVFLVLTLTCLVSAFHPRFHHSPHHERASHQKRKSSARQNAQTEVVQTRTGPVAGIQSKTENKKKIYTRFSGIPYAKPPIGDLRFRAPQRPDNWTDIYNATYERNICTQTIDNYVTGDEDCLYINVYTPQLPTNGSRLLPVIIYFHGGAWIYSGGNYDTYGPDYLIDEDVVVVTFNFRLGIFGFLYTGDAAAPGNNGLLDQLEALVWVSNNIDAFGGDPHQITLYGQSSGGSSIAYILQLNLKGRVKGAILHSGTSLAIWALSRLAEQGALKTALALNIIKDNTTELVESLRHIDFMTLQNTSKAVENYLITPNPLNGFVYGPVRDAFLVPDSYERLINGSYTHIPMLIGYNSDEANGMYPLNKKVQQSLRNDKSAAILVPADLHITNDTIRNEVGQSIKRHYFGLSTIYSERQITKYLNDHQFLRGVRKYAQLVMNDVNTYFYRFSYIGKLGNPTRKSYFGVGHAEDVNYVFKVGSQENVTAIDKGVRYRLVRWFTNFAKTQNPTPERSKFLQYLIWPLANSSSTIRYLDIGNLLTINSDPEGKNMKFWDEIYSKYGVRPFDTY